MSPTDTASIESWVNLLSISTVMEFPRAREHAIAAIYTYQGRSDSDGLVQLTPAQMIQITNMYDVEKWLETAYEDLAERPEIIDEEESEMIGMKGVLVIMKAREIQLKEVIRDMQVTSVNSGDHSTEGKAIQRGEMGPSDGYVRHSEATKSLTICRS